MSNQFFTPGTLKIFDPTNVSEHELINSFNSEFTEIKSPPILWFSFDPASTKVDMDTTDKLYEKATKGKEKFLKPVEVIAIVERSPIIQELTKMGFSQLEEINFMTPIHDILGRLGKEPREGDLFRISQFELDGVYKHTFYKVSSVKPMDDVLGRYTNYLILGEMSNMNSVDDETKKYLGGN